MSEGKKWKKEESEREMKKGKKCKGTKLSP